MRRQERIETRSMCPHWGIADGEAPRSQPHKIVPAKGTRNGLRSCRRRDPRGTNIILRKQRRRYLRWHNVLNAMEREREEYRQRRVAFLAEIRREVKDTERSCRRVATAAGTAVSIRAPGTARILYKLVHRVLPRLSECPPRAPAVGMACNRRCRRSLQRFTIAGGASCYAWAATRSRCL